MLYGLFPIILVPFRLAFSAALKVNFICSVLLIKIGSPGEVPLFLFLCATALKLYADVIDRFHRVAGGGQSHIILQHII